jgi:hypothetical protein
VPGLQSRWLKERFAEDCDAQIPNVTQKFTLLETEKRNMQNDALSKLGLRGSPGQRHDAGKR